VHQLFPPALEPLPAGTLVPFPLAHPCQRPRSVSC
jgi:hypothetical protein